MVAYGSFPYGDVAGCGNSYVRIWFIPLWRRGRPVGAHTVAYGPFIYGAVSGL